MNAQPTDPGRERWLPWLVGVLSLSPLIWCHRYFSELWWFGDDWDLLDQIDRIGLWKWTFQVFAENFVPLFKIFWGGLALVGGGSYLPMIYLLWITHAFTVVVLVRLLRRAGFGWAGALLAAGTFGLTAGNLETLAWSVQWSAILASTFFILAADWHLRHRPELQPWSAKTQGVLVALLAASALSFSRGVLSGAVLAAVSVLPLTEPLGNWSRRLRTAALCVAPAFGVALLIFVFSTGNHHQMAAGNKRWIWSAVEFGTYYWAATPLHRLINPGTYGPYTTFALGLAKLTIVVWALTVSKGAKFRLLVALLLLDLGNAVLLGIGRYHTGLEAANGSRYQYMALICTLPFAACLLDTLLAKISLEGVRHSVATVVIGAVFVLVALPWPRDVDAFAGWRGRGARELLIHSPKPPPTEAVPGIPFLPTARAKELIRRYHLH